jgi:hypothetical protein
MSIWNGRWRNQYGSHVEIEVDKNGVVSGSFTTALEDSSFHGMTVPIRGFAHGDVIGFSAAAAGKTGSAAVSYTGILREGKIETLWHTVAGHTLSARAEGEPARLTEVGAWRAFGTNLDTFERAKGDCTYRA